MTTQPALRTNGGFENLRPWLAASALVLVLAAVSVVWTWIHASSRAMTTGIKNATFTAMSDDGRWVAQADKDGAIGVLDTRTGAAAHTMVGRVSALLIVVAPNGVAGTAPPALLAYEIDGRLWGRFLAYARSTNGSELRLEPSAFPVTSWPASQNARTTPTGWIGATGVLGVVAAMERGVIAGVAAFTAPLAKSIWWVTWPGSAINLDPGVTPNPLLEHRVVQLPVQLSVTAIAGLANGDWLLGTADGDVQLLRSGFNRAFNQAPPALRQPRDSVRRITVLADNISNKAKADAVILLMSLNDGGISYDAKFSPDGKRIVTASIDNTARVWDAATGVVVGNLRGHSGDVWSVAFSPDGTRIATASEDQTARVWDAVTGEAMVVLRGHDGRVWSAEFSPDGRRIVTASRESAQVWDARTGKEILRIAGHAAGFKGDDAGSFVTSAAFSADGKRIVIALFDSTASVRNAATGKEMIRLRGHKARVRSASFSSDGQRVVTASEDKTARVWDAATGKEISRLTGHEDTVSSAVFSRDGNRIVTASEDNTARVWDAATGKEISRLTGHEGTVSSAVFSRDGNRIVTASLDNTARIWEVEEQGRTKFVAVLESREVLDGIVTPSGAVGLTPTHPEVPRALLGDGVRWGRSIGGTAIVDGSTVGRGAPAGVAFKDCAQCPVMVVIPAGAFAMGASANEAGRNATRETPQHRVFISSSFAAAKFEVTRGEWRAFARDTGRSPRRGCFTLQAGDSQAPPSSVSSGEVTSATMPAPLLRPAPTTVRDRSSAQFAAAFQSRPDKSWEDPGFPQSNIHPVDCISWWDAQAYVSWLSRKTGHRYRLLTEAEWEYAARAGTSAARYWGESADSGCAFANMADLDKTTKNWWGAVAQCHDGFGYTSPVGRHRANAFGLHDMLGNLWEWVDDCWHENYTSAPMDGKSWGSKECERRTLRGGSWLDAAQYSRAANRYGLDANLMHFDLGLRVARDL